MATQHSFVIGNTSYTSWELARKAATSTQGVVTVVRDDGRSYTFGVPFGRDETAAPTAAARLVREHRAQQASTPAVQPAPNPAVEKYFADLDAKFAKVEKLLSELSAVVDDHNARLEARAPNRRARKS
jgi:hypothetical protein